jgi:hypothetical protein
VLDRNLSIDTSLTADGTTPTARYSAAPHCRFRDARRSARLCRERATGDEFPRCARAAGAQLSICRAARRCAGACPALRDARPSSPATASRWSPRPAPNSPPASSARSTPVCGRCRCRCRPASAAATPMSTSCRHAVEQRPFLFLFPPSSATMPPPPPRSAGSRRATGTASTRSSGLRQRCPSRPAATSATSNIRAARRASRTASRSPTTPCSTICAPMASGSSTGHRPRRQLAAVVP